MTVLHVKIPSITAFPIISFAIILPNMFAKQVLSLLILCWFRQKKFENGIIEGENVQEKTLSKLSIVEETIGDSCNPCPAEPGYTLPLQTV